MKTIKNAAIIFSSKILLFWLNLAKSILIHRLLGPFGKGQFALITQIPKFLTTLGNLGIGVSSVYYTGRKHDRLTDIVSTSLVVALVLGVLFIGLLYIVYDYLPDSLIRDIRRDQILIASLIIPFSLIYIYNSSILLGSDRVKNVVSLTIFASLSLLLYFLFFNIILQRGVMGAVTALIASTLTVAVLSIFYVGQQVKVRIKFNSAYFKKSVLYGLKAHLGTCAQFLNYRVDIFFVQYYLGFTKLGYYTLAVAIAELLWELPHSMSTALFQRVSSVSKSESDRLTPKICRNTLFLMLLISGCVFLFSEFIIQVAYSSAFLPAAVALKILLPGIVVLSISKVLSSHLTGRGKPIYSTRAALIALGVNIPLNFWLIPKWGISGAAFASTIAYFIQALVVLMYFVKVSRNKVYDTLVIKREDFTAYRRFLGESYAQIRRYIRPANQ
jgi:O-antigen/teichoic acid export membrane protein